MSVAKGANLSTRPVVTPMAAAWSLKPLRNVWRVVGIAALLLAFCGLSALTLLEIRRDTWRQATTSSRNLVAALSQDVARSFGAYDAVLQHTASLVGDPSLTDLTPALQRKILFGDAAVDRYFDSLLVLDRNGRIL